MLSLVWFPPGGDMVFDSITFIFFFLPIVLSLYFLIPKRYRNTFLIGASLIFYAWERVMYVIVLLLYMISNYYFGVLIEKYKFSAPETASRKAKTTFVVSLAFNLGILIIFKYFNFIVANINSLIEFTGYAFGNPKIHPPMPSRPATSTAACNRYGLAEPSAKRSSKRPASGMRIMCVRLFPA